jgi:hypothetical protein
LKVFEGYNLNLTCNFSQNKTIKTKWKWYFNESELLDSNIARKIENDTQSSIQIKNLSKENVGTYRCEAKIADKIEYTEEFAYDKFAGRYDSLWLFLGICLESFILCGAVFIYEKKFSKPIVYDDDDDDDRAKEL